MYKYQITTKFDDSITFVESKADALQEVKKKAKELNKDKNQFIISPAKY